MAIETRATTWVEFGRQPGGRKIPVISASISDSYVQGAGLITTTGTCVLQGIVGTTQGGLISFFYEKEDLFIRRGTSPVKVTRRIPRGLVVFSSFADPIRNTTTVEFGCPLAYGRDLSDVRLLRGDPSRLAEMGLIDEDISSLDPGDRPLIPSYPVTAEQVRDACCFAIGISPGTRKLDNLFYVDTFDLSGGFFNVLNDILISENICGYADPSGLELQYLSLDNLGRAGASPWLDESRIIDITPIGVGGIPGGVVNVSYSSLKLQAPDDVELFCDLQDDDEDEERERITGWSADTASTQNSSFITIAHQDRNGNPTTTTYSTLENTYDETQYKILLIDGKRLPTYLEPDQARALVEAINLQNSIPGIPEEQIRNVEFKNVVTQRTTFESKSAVSVAGAWVTAALNTIGTFGDFPVTSETVEQFSYDGNGDEVFKILTRRGSQLYGLGMAGVPMEFDGQLVTPPLGEMLLEQITVDTYRNGNFVQTVTRRYGPWIASISGQQSIAESRDSFNSASDVQNYLNNVLSVSGSFLLDVTVSSERTGSRGEEAPSEIEILTEQFAEEGGDPNNGFRQVSESQSLFESGDGAEGNYKQILTFTMPYAPDDAIVPYRSENGGWCYKSIDMSEKARQNAKAFGRTQNKLLQGNRYGMNVTSIPEYMPTEIGGSFAVQARGVFGGYVANATTWTIDSTGLVVSTEGLAMGMIGR